MEKSLQNAETYICYKGRFFVPQVNIKNGEADRKTIFEYHQKGNILWAEYAGGDIIKGHLIGLVAANGEWKDRIN